MSSSNNNSALKSTAATTAAAAAANSTGTGTTTSAKPSRAPQVQHTGIYKNDAVKDAAESLNISVPDPVATALASDVEYRIHQVIEEAARFMRHGRRTTLTTSDIDNAFRVLNIEPLYGHSSSASNPPVFRRALPFPGSSGSSAAGAGAGAAAAIYFVEDEEIDFDRVLREEKIALPKGVNWTAHWLAVEGVQPLIPENPPAIPRDQPEDTASGAKAEPQVNGTGPMSATNQAAKRQQQAQLLVKHVLSRELQLYYTRLTTSLLPPTNDFAKRTAALASLRHDAGLQALLPYLIRWVGEGVVNSLKEGVQTENDGRILEVMLDVISALLENNTLFVEPYLHQLLPPILSTLLHSTLPPTHATHLRTIASQTLSHVLTQHSTTYPSLSPRIMKTLLLALVSPGKSKGTREGAIRGLIGVGKEAVRKGLVESGGARLVEGECAGGASLGDGEADALIDSVMDALRVLQPSSEMVYPLDMTNDADARVVVRLRELLGDMFAERVCGDAAWSREILGRTTTS